MLVDGVSKRALEAVVELVYTGSHPVGHHGLSVEEVLEAGAALGLPLTAGNVFCDPGKAIFEVTAPSPEEQSYPAGFHEQSLKVSRALKPQDYQAPCIDSAVEQQVTDEEGKLPAGVLGRSEKVAGMEMNNADVQMNEKGVLPAQDTSSVSFLPKKRHSSFIRIPLQCDLCTFSTSAPSLLQIHVERVHRQGSPPALICPHCGKGAAGYRGLQIHMAHTHKIYRNGNKGKDGQHALNEQQQLQLSQQQPVQHQQQFCAPVKPPQQMNHKMPPPLYVGNKNAKRSKSVGGSTRRSSTSMRSSYRRSSDSCDFTPTAQVLWIDFDWHFQSQLSLKFSSAVFQDNTTLHPKSPLKICGI